MAFLTATLCLTAFAILAVIDGFYLHLIKYQLFWHKESQFEHLTHTLRAILFPIIVYLLFVVKDSPLYFYLGILVVIIDVVVLGIDAFVEKDSRAFMGGLPRWEYILHLMVNGFHFASIAVFLSIKIQRTGDTWHLAQDLHTYSHYELFHFVSTNLIPGAILLAALHILTSIEKTQKIWFVLRKKLICC